MKENIIVWCLLKQISVILCFTVLSIVFNHWWIILFTLLFMDVNVNYNEKNENEVV